MLSYEKVQDLFQAFGTTVKTVRRTITHFSNVFFFILIFRLVRGKVIKKNLCNTEAEFKHRKFIFRSNEAIRMAFGKNILSDAQSPSLVWIS